jgi:hypothetical protein
MLAPVVKNIVPIGVGIVSFIAGFGTKMWLGKGCINVKKEQRLAAEKAAADALIANAVATTDVPPAVEVNDEK